MANINKLFNGRNDAIKFLDEHGSMILNKHVPLGLSILELSKMFMCEFWYDYVKSKYGEKMELYYVDTENFIVYIKTEYI